MGLRSGLEGGCGGDARQDAGCGWGGGELVQLAEETVADVAAGLLALGEDEFRRRGEQAVDCVGVDDFDHAAAFGLGGEGGLTAAGQVVGGDLEAVEEQTGGAVIERALGDAVEDLADGELDGGPVFGDGEGEGFGGGDFGARGDARGGWPAVGVVVEAKIFFAQGGGAAAVTIGEDVAALEAFGWSVHGVDLPREWGAMLLVRLRWRSVVEGPGLGAARLAFVL